MATGGTWGDAFQKGFFGSRIGGICCLDQLLASFAVQLKYKQKVEECKSLFMMIVKTPKNPAGASQEGRFGLRIGGYTVLISFWDVAVLHDLEAVRRPS